MSTQTKSKLFLLVIAILLITNIGMLIFFTGHKEPPRGRGRGWDVMLKEFLQKDIEFSDSQLQQYDSLSKQQKEDIKASFNVIKAGKEQQLKVLGSKSFNDSAITEAVQQSVENQKTIELKMLTNLVAIRKLCTADQLPKFDSLIYKAWTHKPDGKKKPEEKNK